MKIKSIFLVFFSLLLCSACSQIDNVPNSSDAETSDLIESALSSDGSYKTESSLVSEESSLVEESETEQYGNLIKLSAPQTSENSLLSLLESIEITKGEGHLPDAEPGDLIPLDRMDKADQSLVGTTAEICLTPWEEGFCFRYVYDKDTGVERLTLIGKSVLLVCETDLKGIDGLYDALTNGAAFSCKILSVTAVMYEEMMYAWTATHPDGAFSDVACYEPNADSSATQECFGLVGKLSKEDVYHLAIYSATQPPVESVKGVKGVYVRMYERYGLLSR